MTPATHPLHLVIAGGGITGLSAAWYATQQAQAIGLPLHTTLLEASSRWGGKLYTDYIEGHGEAPFIVEGGPDSFITQKPWAWQLARELGLAERLLGTNDAARKVFVLSKGRPLPLPEGVLLIVPTRFMPFALSPLISPWGKLRMGLDLFIPARRDGADETLADFVRRRLGQEALDKIAEPLMSGIYNAEADRQSLLATFPRFRALEEQHGSLIRGMLAVRRQPRPASPDGKAVPSLFATLRGGTQELVEALVDRLPGDLRLNAGVEGITRDDAGAYRVALSDGTEMACDALILATPAYVAADLVRSLAPDAAKELARIRYVSTGTVSLGFRQEDAPGPLPGFGLVIPRSERRPINAITVSSTKFNHRAPEGHILLRVFFGGSRSPQSMALDDGALLSTVRQELGALLGIQAEPIFHRIYRWERGNPQYDVGHLERVKAIETALPTGLYVTGSPYRGIGIPDCVHQARQTAEKAVAHLQERMVAQAT